MPVPALLETYPPYPFTIERGRGDRIWDTEGNAYFDFYGGHCVCLTGHSHPRVADAIAAQARELIFYSTAGKVAVRERAAEALIAFAGAPMASAFFCNSGAEANENALKIAAKRTGRFAFGCTVGGWHGRSTLCLSVTDDPKITTPYAPLLAESVRVPFNDFAALEATDFSGLAAFILEPIQSMSGIREADEGWLAALRAKCDASGTLLIFDEIQTGFGRLGKPFAKDVYGVAPDMTTCAKGIASGVPMGAVLMTEAVAAAIKPGDMGTTFGGGPLACAALLATLEVVRDEGLMANATDAEAKLRVGLAGTCVQRVSGRGLLLGLDCGPHAAALKKALLDARILVGGSSDPAVLRLMPPLTLTDGAIDALLASVRAFTETLS